MLFENRKKSAKTKLYFMLTLFFYLILIVGSLVFDIFQGYSFIIITTILFILAFIIITHLKFYYFSFDIKEGKLIFRFSSLSLVISVNKIIEIPQALFVKFNIKESFFGYKKELFLYQKLKGGVAKYPPISISLLNRKEVNKISKMLNAVLIHNKK